MTRPFILSCEFTVDVPRRIPVIFYSYTVNRVDGSLNFSISAFEKLRCDAG